jgi:hypothetical protein
MKGGYESLTWINDKDGKEYVCAIDTTAGKRSYDQLSDAEKKHCEDVNQIVGTERW